MSKHENTVQALLAQYRTTGASFGKIKRLAEVPLFTDSKITRMLQLADFVARLTNTQNEITTQLSGNLWKLKGL